MSSLSLTPFHKHIRANFFISLSIKFYVTFIRVHGGNLCSILSNSKNFCASDDSEKVKKVKNTKGKIIIIIIITSLKVHKKDIMLLQKWIKRRLRASSGEI